MASGELTTSEYIVHHLTNLHIGHGFWSVHLDTLIVSGLLGLVMFGLMAKAAKSRHQRCAGRLAKFRRDGRDSRGFASPRHLSCP